MAIGKEALGAPPRPHRPSALERFIKSRTLRWGLTLGTIGVGGYEAYQVPVVQQAIDSSYHDLLRKLGLEVAVPTTFDNKLNKGSISDSNIQLISQEEAKKTNLQPIESDNSLTFLFPFQLPKGSQVTYEKTLSEAIPQDARAEGEQKGIKDNTVFVLPKETTVIAPINANILVDSGREDWGENPNLSPDTRLFYYDEIKNITYVLWIFASDDASGHNAFYPLVPTQKYEPSIWRGTSWEQLPKIQQGAPILKTTKENQVVQLNVKAYKGKVVGPQAEVIDKTFSVVTPQFLTTQTSESSKLLVLGK